MADVGLNMNTESPKQIDKRLLSIRPCSCFVEARCSLSVIMVLHNLRSQDVRVWKTKPVSDLCPARKQVKWGAKYWCMKEQGWCNATASWCPIGEGALTASRGKEVSRNDRIDATD